MQTLDFLKSHLNFNFERSSHKHPINLKNSIIKLYRGILQALDFDSVVH
jgi:hypothetical protein